MSKVVKMFLKRSADNKQIECFFEENGNKINIAGFDSVLAGKTSIVDIDQFPVDVNDEWCGLWVFVHDKDDFNRTKTTEYPFGQNLLVWNNSFSQTKAPIGQVPSEEINVQCDREMMGKWLSEIGDEDIDKSHDYTLQKNLWPILHIADVDGVRNLRGSEAIPQTEFRRYYNIMDSSIWNYLIKDLKEEEDGELRFDKAVKSIFENYQKGLYDLLISQEYADLNARICKQSYLVNLGDGHSEGVSPFIFHSEYFVKKQLIKKEFEEVRPTPTLSQIVDRKWRILLVDDKAFVGMKKNRERDVVSEFQNLPWNSKLNIIIRLIKNQFRDYKNATIAYREYNELSPINNEPTILIEYASSLRDAYEALKSKKYDIILLDYLLKPLEDGAKNRYGYELLEFIYKQVLLEEQTKVFFADKNMPIENVFGQIMSEPKYEEILKLVSFLYKKNYFSENKNYEIIENLYVNLCEIEEEEKDLDVIRKNLYSIPEEQKEKIVKDISKIIQLLSNKENKEFTDKENVKIGPMGRFYIVFTSAYSSAVYERLLAQGLNTNEDYWCISTGACPTNTPQLFLYNLIKMMEMRLDNTGILKLTPRKIYELVEGIYNKERGVPRECANNHYQDVLSLQYHYRKMLADVEIPEGDSLFDIKESVLISEFIKNNVNLGGMLEHLTQLVHLTAFGTVRQWPEMWEEYIYFKSLFKAQLGIERDSVSDNEFTKMATHIEDYIKTLKSQ